MENRIKNYLCLTAFPALVLSLGIAVSCSSASRRSSAEPRDPIFPAREASADTAAVRIAEDRAAAASADQAGAEIAGPVTDTLVPTGRELSPEIFSDTFALSGEARRAVERTSASERDSLARIIAKLDDMLAASPDGTVPDSIQDAFLPSLPDSLRGLSLDSLRSIALSRFLEPVPGELSPGERFHPRATSPPPADTAPAKKKDFLEHPVIGKNRDSLVYDVKKRLIFVYGEGDLTYEDNNLKADFMILNANTKEIYGTGVPDTLGKLSRPEFIQGGANYTMDTITYNLNTGKAKIRGLATKDGEGYLLGREVKKMGDNVINLAHGVYTTCDRLEHPHYYIAMTKAKVIPGKKIIMGPAYLVMEDVPIYFLGLPGGFFPISSGPRSGFIMPTYGEETRRGFFLRNGGYYFTFGDYADLTLTAGVYTLGSWEAAVRSNYIKRYKFRGSLTANYAKTIYGERNSSDYQNTGNFRIAWTHTQDPKARPNSTFSASVNFSTSGYNRNGATQIQDLLNTQTNSSISWSRNWMVGSVPLNLTAAFSHSQNSQNKTISLTLPNVSFSVGSFSPLKRRIVVGKQRWYEKITVSYAMQLSNSVSTTESELFTSQTLQDMQNGVSHRIPVKTSFNFWGLLNFTPSFNYNETWNFKRIRMAWDPVEQEVVELDPEFGFFRMYNYNFNGSFSTKIFGMFQMKERPGRSPWLKAVRHVMTPTVGFTFAPDFTSARYGFQEYYQTDAAGNLRSYVPVRGSPTMSPSGPQASINFSLSNQLQMKVASKSDTSGVKKIKLIEQLSASGSYNFLPDSMNLSTISLSFRTNIWKNFGINLSAVWDPYVVVDRNGSAVRTGRYNIGNGKFGRIASTGWSFGYTFNSSKAGQPVSNDINSGGIVAAYANPFDMNYQMDPLMRRQQMVSAYYDFNIPWNFGFNYSVSYSNNGLRTTVTQNLGFNGSVTLTGKWGISFNGGFDLAKGRFSPMSVNINRDLHCWAMSFQWVPIGTLKSWQFHIGVKSSMLADLKYDKSSSRYDNLEQ